MKKTHLMASVVLGMVALLAVLLTLILSGVIGGPTEKLVFRSASAEKVYDGKALTADDVLKDVELISGSLKDGHRFEVEILGTQTNAGVSANEMTVKIFDENNADVTETYDIEIQAGNLTVLKRPAKISVNDVSKEYDGKPLQAVEWTIIDDVLKGHSFETSIAGERTEVGEGKSNITARIIDKEGNDVTENYELVCIEGRLTVKPNTLTFQSANAEKTYDGTPLVATSENGEPLYEITTGALLEGHKEIVVMTGSRTLAGKGSNTFGVQIIEEKTGKDVTNNYTIVSVYGELTVFPREISVTSNSANKIYDGTPLTSEGAEVTSGELVGNHQLQVTTTGEQTNAGQGLNLFSVSVIDPDNDNLDVSRNYNITIVNGILTVNPRKITITTGGDIKYFDGLPLTSAEYNITQGEFLPEHSVTIETTGSQTDAGASNNTAMIAVVHIDGEEYTDVTSNYAFTFVYGQLIVYKRTITIRSDSASKTYDGLELTANGYKIVSTNKLVGGHHEEVVISGTLTDVGQTNNTIAEVKILDGTGKDVAYNYDIVQELGLLTVYAPETSPLPPNDPTVDDDTDKNQDNQLDESGDIGGGDGSSELDKDTIVFSVKTSVSRAFFLRSRSYGSYRYKGWNSAQPYNVTIDGTHSMTYLTGSALGASGYQSIPFYVQPISPNYLIPYYEDMDQLNYQIQTSDVSVTGSVASDYALYVYAFDYLTDGGASIQLPSEYQDYEEDYREFVYDQYCKIPDDTKAYMQTIIDSEGFDVSDPAVIGAVAEYIRNSAVYNLDYDKALDEESDVAVEFLRTYKEGICQHYATAGTLLYRALGIPARYTVGYFALTEEDTWVNITPAQAHAWVEVYIDGIGWIQVDVTGSGYEDNATGGSGGTGGEGTGGEGGEGTGGEGGEGTGGEGGEGTGGEGGGGEGGGSSGTPTKIKISVVPENLYKKYDGTALISPSGVCTSGLVGNKEFNEAMTMGYSYAVDFEDVSITDVGKSQYGIATADGKLCITIYDYDGNDVTEQFEISASSGILHVYEKEINFKSSSKSKMYDGTPLLPDADGYTCDELISTDHKIVVVFTEQITNAGKVINNYTLKIVDTANGDEDVSYKYKINRAYGELEVTKLHLTVTADSVTKTFDPNNPEVLTCNTYTYTGTLLSGHELNVVITGSLSSPGRATNVIDSVAVIDTASGEDVTSCYSFTLVNGTLKFKM